MSVDQFYKEFLEYTKLYHVLDHFPIIHETDALNLNCPIVNLDLAFNSIWYRTTSFQTSENLLSNEDNSCLALKLICKQWFVDLFEQHYWSNKSEEIREERWSHWIEFRRQMESICAEMENRNISHEPMVWVVQCLTWYCGWYEKLFFLIDHRNQRHETNFTGEVGQSSRDTLCNSSDCQLILPSGTKSQDKSGSNINSFQTKFSKKTSAKGKFYYDSIFTQVSLNDQVQPNVLLTEECKTNKLEKWNRFKKNENYIAPLNSSIVYTVDRLGSNSKHREYYRKVGLREIGSGRVAVFTLAGGEATRLCFNPKAMFDVGLVSHKTLLQLQAERIVRLQELARQQCIKASLSDKQKAKRANHATITWYVMTSDSNHQIILQYLRTRNYFGLLHAQVVVFKQHSMPCFDENGKFQVKQHNEVMHSPASTGDLFEAMQCNGIFLNLAERGIRHMHVIGIEDLLVKPADPYFIGLCHHKEVEIGVKVISRSKVNDATLPVLCKWNSGYRVVPSTHFPETLLWKKKYSKRNEPMMFEWSPILNLYLTTSFARVVDPGLLQHHMHQQTMPCFGSDGAMFVTTMAYKAEKDICDVVSQTCSMITIEVEIGDEWAPVTYRSYAVPKGVELTPHLPYTSHQARNLFYHRSLRHILAAGGSFFSEHFQLRDLNSLRQWINETNKSQLEEVETNGENENGNKTCVQIKEIPECPFKCEISPKCSYDGEGLDKFVNGHCFSTNLTIF